MLVYNLPPESATARRLNLRPDGWTVDTYVLADVFHALTGKPHPARPKPTAEGKKSGRHAQLLARLRAQRERLATPDPAEPAV